MNPNREYGFTFGILGVACAGLFSVYTQPWLVVLLVNISLFFVILSDMPATVRAYS
jgi:hypothetical protein